VRALTDPRIPTNGGCFRPVQLKLPKGSIVNPEEPAPVNARTATIKRITGCMIGALAPVMPGKVPAAPAGELLVLAFGGRQRDGAPYVVGELIAGGSGASAGGDGGNGGLCAGNACSVASASGAAGVARITGGNGGGGGGGGRVVVMTASPLACP
jgi:N-methylhydantoinase B/oxoprolinase/acetone carboxylase alpha subunit